MAPSMRISRRKRVRRGAVIAVLTASAFLGGREAVFAQGLPATPPSTGQTHRYFIKIGGGNLTDALGLFTTQTGIRVATGSLSLAGLKTQGATGSLSAADVLSALLAGSGLTFHFTSPTSVTLDPVAAAGNGSTLPPVHVEGEAQPVASNADPYADPAAPYKADRLSSSKFTEPILNTPRTITVLTKEALDDKNATSVREIARSTAGVTLGSGEGGNAFGDRFFIRGIDARNDVFVDGVRDPGVSIRENFDTEQVEILRGPASSFAGRGTAGGALNIVTKAAGPSDFYNSEFTGGFSDNTARAAIDVNQVIDQHIAVRLNAMGQNASVAGRKDTTDNRAGVALAATVKPTDSFSIDANYSHAELTGLPDFGVPYDLAKEAPVTQSDVARNTYYGITNRDFTKTIQDIGTLNASWKISDSIVAENKIRTESSLLNYIGTIPENPSATGASAPYSSTATFFSGYTQLNAQSRYEKVFVFADQPQITFTFATGKLDHALVFGGDFDAEHISIDSYTGLTSELATGPVAFTSSGAPIVSVYNPVNDLAGLGTPQLTGNPQQYRVNTTAFFLIDTIHFGEHVLLNGGVRHDDYNIISSNTTSSRQAETPITSYNVGLTIKPTKAGSIYVAYATAAEPVGDELDATASSYGGLSATQNPQQIYGPQLSRSTEVGTKWELFDRHVLATLAGFQTNVTNARETAPAGIPGVVSGTIIAGAAYRVNGVDLELAGNITRKWSILGGLVLMNPKVTASVNPLNVGLQLANIAPRSFSLLSKYQLTKTFEFGGQAVYNSQVKGGSLLAANGAAVYPAPPNPTLLPSYWRFDVFGEHDLSKNVELKLYVANLFNQTYYDSLYQSAVPFIRVAPGRAISLIGTVKI